ncbi:hypothetical protein B0H14DRAFT_2574590 [Mycena olivaceomarginata]|nr:hypothetical protein B0H14DRAFT_2574590 [Mycena olivaceomarginata]
MNLARAQETFKHGPQNERRKKLLQELRRKVEGKGEKLQSHRSPSMKTVQVVLNLASHGVANVQEQPHPSSLARNWNMVAGRAKRTDRPSAKALAAEEDSEIEEDEEDLDEASKEDDEMVPKKWKSEDNRRNSPRRPRTKRKPRRNSVRWKRTETCSRQMDSYRRELWTKEDESIHCMCRRENTIETSRWSPGNAKTNLNRGSQ